MQKALTLSPVLRAIAVIGAVAALVTSITFAALQSQATLTDNIINSGTASLMVSSTNGCSDGTTGFGSSAAGFTFDGVVPGGDPVPTPGHGFCLKNDGDVDFDISARISSTPSTTGTVDQSKVDLILSCTGDDGTFSVTSDLATLAAGPVDLTGAALNAGDTASCTAQAQMDADAVSGGGASISNIDLEFSGTNTSDDTTT